MKLFRKIKGKLGFTLAEMLIVVAILAILTAVAAPNVAKYSRSINLRELNDSARAIYMAAEHKFMNEIEMGRTLPEGAAVNTNALEKRYGGDASAVNVKYLKSSEEPLKKLMTSGSAAGDSTGVIESQLYDNNYIVEYNPETGDVFGVFYSEDDDLSGYESESCYLSISDMQKEKLIGYYGSDTVKPEEKTNSEVLPKPEVSIKNKEKLVLTITSPNFLNTENKVYIAVKICDAADNKKSVELIPRNGKIYMTPNKTVHFILDTLSDTLTDYTTSAELTDVKLKVFEKPFSEWATDDFGNYLIDPGAKLDIYVTFYDDKGKSIDRTVKVSANSLFADSSSLTEADIEYGRHLQNLDKCSAINTAVIKKTINFASTAGNYEGWESTYPDGGSYKTFVALAQNNLKEIYAKSGSEIQNIIVKTASDKAQEAFYNGAGLFAVVEDMKFHDLKFVNPKIDCEEVGAGVVCGVSLNGSTFENITVVNPIVRSSNYVAGCGGLVGYLNAKASLEYDNNMKTETIKNCAVYVSSDGNWENPMSDPYLNYCIECYGEGGYAGGLVGIACDLSCEKSYASVKVKGIGSAGGLIGYYANYYSIPFPLELTDCFSGGHTYKGEFEGTYIDSGVEKKFDLMDNISSEADAGGIVGTLFEASVNIHGKVFSSCSVSSKRGSNERAVLRADPAIVETESNSIKTETNDDVIYVLGAARITDGATVTEIKKSADTHVKTGDDVKVDDSSATVGKRYDLKVSSVYKYPVPTGMTMHGDWPSSDAVTGFFYWEKHGEDYNFHVLCDDCHEKEYENLCKKQDGVDISESGYGLFTIGGDLSGALYYGRTGINYDSDVKAKSLSAIMGDSYADTDAKLTKALIIALGEMDDGLKTLKPEDLVTDICTTAKDEDKANGNIKVTVNGKSFTFTPCFYGIAESESESCGGSSSPFVIRTAQQLKNISFFLDKKNFSYQQQHDILPGTIDPIGSSENSFDSCTYDGGSYRIIDAKFNTTADSEYAGLFGVTDGAKLENIVMFVEAAAAENFVEIKGKTVGVIVGNAENASGEITNCVAAGYTVIGSENSGGIAGVSACPITNCEANIRFGKVQNVAGGIVGNGAEISSCYALVHGIESPSSDMDLGGIAGAASEVKNCYVIFSGQTVGYPVANKAEYSTCYYVNDEGYYSVSESGKTNSAQGVALESLKTLEGKNLDKFNLSPVTYDSDVTPSGNNYQYPAVFKDGGTTEHYGPVPAKIMYTSSLVRGPVAGIFDVHMYGEDNGTGGLNTDNSIDGLFSYNRAGVMNYDNMWDGSKPSYDEFIGVFTCKESFFEDPSHNPSLLEFKDIMVLDYFSPRVRVLVDGEEIKKENIRELNYGSVRSGYYQFKSDAGVTDEFFVNHQPGIPVQKAFKLFTLWKNGKEIKAEDVHSGIQVMYLDDYGKWGLLIECKAPSFRGEKTSSYVDSLPIPKVGAFIASTYAPHTEDMSRYINPYFASAYLTENGSDGSAYGQIGDNAGAQAYLCVLVEKDYSKYLNSNDLVFNICGAPATLEKWDNVINAEIANAKALNFDNYDVYVITNMLSITRNNSVNTGQHTIEAQFGSREIMHIEYTKLQKDLIKVDKYIMPKFGMGALYFKAKTDQNPDQYFVNGKFADLSEEGTYTKAADFGYSNTEGLLKTGTYLIYIQTSRLSERNDFKVEINGKEYSLGNEVVSENIGWGRGDFTALIINTTDTINDDDVIQLKFRNDVVMKFAAKLF